MVRFFVFLVGGLVFLLVGLFIGAREAPRVDRSSWPVWLNAIVPEGINPVSSQILEVVEEAHHTAPLVSMMTAPVDEIEAVNPAGSVDFSDAVETVVQMPLNLTLMGYQGGYLRGHVGEGQTVSVNGEPLAQASGGGFFYGIDRNQTGRLILETAGPQPGPYADLSVTERAFASGQVIATTRSANRVEVPMGFDDLFLDESQTDIDPTLQPASRGLNNPDPARIQREASSKAKALESRADLDGFLQDWIYPIASDFRVSSSWGAGRVKNGTTQVHYGVDLAAPTGTPLIAPARGKVTLAQSDFFYEGGVVFIDHGLGLTSVYLHMSEISVSEGQIVEQGETIGAVGATGSATGPHVCWRLYWDGRDKRVDPMSLVKAMDR